MPTTPGLPRMAWPRTNGECLRVTREDQQHHGGPDKGAAAQRMWPCRLPKSHPPRAHYLRLCNPCATVSLLTIATALPAQANAKYPRSVRAMKWAGVLKRFLSYADEAEIRKKKRNIGSGTSCGCFSDCRSHPYCFVDVRAREAKQSTYRKYHQFWDWLLAIARM